MKKRFWRTLAAGLAAVLALACCAACQGDDALPAALGVEPELGQVADHWDDHGGMGNDGSAYWEVTFSPEEAAALEQALPAAEGWQPLPLSDEARRLHRRRGQGAPLLQLYRRPVRPRRPHPLLRRAGHLTAPSL